MLSYIKDIANILTGKTMLDPQHVKDYFQKKRMYSLVEMNENLLKLSKHRQQVNDQNMLMHLNIQLINQPANIVALFSKPAYKIIVLDKNVSNSNNNSKSDLLEKEIQ